MQICDYKEKLKICQECHLTTHKTDGKEKKSLPVISLLWEVGLMAAQYRSWQGGRSTAKHRLKQLWILPPKSDVAKNFINIVERLGWNNSPKLQVQLSQELGSFYSSPRRSLSQHSLKTNNKWGFSKAKLLDCFHIFWLWFCEKKSLQLKNWAIWHGQALRCN